MNKSHLKKKNLQKHTSQDLSLPKIKSELVSPRTSERQKSHIKSKSILHSNISKFPDK